MEDRTYLESIGLAADGDEDSLWSEYCKTRKISHANNWDRQAHLLAWRLHGDSIIEDMVSRGHEINYAVSPIGGGQIILVDIDKNILIGASDFRKDGCAIGY